MTTSQSLKIYEVFGKYFNNAKDVKIIETNISDKKDVVCTKEDLL